MPPLAATLSVTATPCSTAEALDVSDAIVTPRQPLTVTVAASLSALPHAFVTRTQYVDVAFGVTLTAGCVAPPIAFVVFPFAPAYH